MYTIISSSRAPFGRIYPLGGCLWRCRRYIFVTSTDKRLRSKKPNYQASQKKLNEFLAKDKQRKIAEKENQYNKKLESLKSLTKDVSKILQASKKREEKVQEIKNLKMPSDLEKESEQLYRSLELDARSSDGSVMNSQLASGSKEVGFAKIDPGNSSLIAPVVDLPKSISDRLGLAIKYLTSKRNQNWVLVISQLKESGGLEGINKRDIRKLIDQIPLNQLGDVVPALEEMMHKLKVGIPSAVAVRFMKGIIHGRSIDGPTMKKVKSYIKYLRKHKGKSKLSLNAYETIIEAYGRCGDLDKMNGYLEEMKKFNLQPSDYVYTNILSTCVYKLKNHKQAVEIFDSMKFISSMTKPGTRAYQDIIVSYVNDDNIEKALDLYQEMLVENIPLNQQILVTLARGCSSRPLLRNKSWEFMFEIYNLGWEPSLQTFDYILYLSAKEGDVSLARIFYKKLHAAKAITPRSFGFLLLAYSKSQLNKPRKDWVPFPITSLETGRNFRTNLLASNNTNPSGDTPESFIPFLPVPELTDPTQIMAESSAVWAQALMFSPEFLNRQTCTSFLNIAAEMGSLSDFIDRYRTFTYLDKKGYTTNEIIIEEPEEAIKSNSSDLFEGSEKTKAPILHEMETVKDHKLPRSSLTYVIALKVAGKYRNYKFAQEIWTERGIYRKTDAFKNLPREEKDALDFEFASAMVSCLTKMNLLNDALAILLSTEYQFKWTWKELTELYRAAVEIGDSNITRPIRGITKRAQINYEGKIRPKDFRRYVLERSY